MDPIQSAVHAFILSEFLPGAKPSELTANTPLISGGVLDSLATVRLVAFLEDQYQVTIEPHEASVDYLDTVDQIATIVRSKQAA
jgi:acyl carrier protein